MTMIPPYTKDIIEETISEWGNDIDCFHTMNNKKLADLTLSCIQMKYPKAIMIGNEKWQYFAITDTAKRELHTHIKQRIDAKEDELAQLYKMRLRLKHDQA